MKKMLLGVGSVVVSASSALAAPSGVPSIVQEKITIRSPRVKVAGDGKHSDSGYVLRKGDMLMGGTIKNPVQIKSEKLSVSATKVLYSTTYGAFHASSDLMETMPVKITGIFAQRVDFARQCQWFL